MFFKRKQSGSSLGIQAFLLPLIIIALGIGANMFYLTTIRGNLQRLANNAAHRGLSLGRDFNQPAEVGADFLYDAETIAPEIQEYVTNIGTGLCSEGRCSIKMDTFRVWVNRSFSLTPNSTVLNIYHVSNAPYCGSRDNPCTADRQASAVDTYEWVNNTPAVAVYFEVEIPSPIPLIGENGVVLAHVFGESALYKVDYSNFQEALPWEN